MAYDHDDTGMMPRFKRTVGLGYHPRVEEETVRVTDCVMLPVAGDHQETSTAIPPVSTS